MHRHLMGALLIGGATAWAGSGVSYLKDAAELLEDEGGGCERKVNGRLEDAIDAMKEFQDQGGRSARKEARRALEKVIDAVDDHCRGKVAGRLSKLIAKAERKLENAEDDDDDRRAPRGGGNAEVPRSNGVQLNAGGLTLSVGGSTSTTTATSTSTSGPRGDGRDPMSGSEYQSFLTALQANRNEILRKDSAISALRRSYVSARQLGGVLDQFNNEILKLDVAKAARLTDPMNAVGLSSKFRNSIHQSEFVEVMTQQQ